ncbi:MAG: hypothetical protein MJY89_08000 [Bacteroidales bacterium]|nr:hypothetical protein [Bacteroidales bacterium]
MKKIFALIFGVTIGIGLYAQDSFESEFDSFFNQSVQEFSDFRDRINAEYADFLLSSWKEFNAMMPVERPVEKKVPPVRYDKEEDGLKEATPVPYDVVVPVKDDFKKPKPVSPIKKRDGDKTVNVEFSCFGMPLSVKVPDGKEFKLASINARDLSKAWKKLSSKEYDVILEDCLAIREREGLCDWAYLNMLDAFTTKLLGKGNSATFMTAYLFAQSGYCMRLALDVEKLLFLFGTDFLLYDKPYFPIGGSNYFIFGDNCRTLRIADIPYPEETGLSLIIGNEQNFGRRMSEERKLVSTRYNVSAESSVNEDQIDFFGTYPSSQIGGDPMTQWSIYANSPFSEAVKSKLYPSLQKKIEGKDALEATDILLDFVQTAFKYEYDEKVWGADRVFFAEETLFYPFCDCEDRSILLSRLVRDLLGLKVALVYYPGHLATAVRLPGGPAGDYLHLDDGDYTICDPTFIGAPVGNTMSGMDNSAAKVVLLK